MNFMTTVNSRPLLLTAAIAAFAASAAAETVGPNVFVDDGEKVIIDSSEAIETTGDVTVAPGGKAAF